MQNVKTGTIKSNLCYDPLSNDAKAQKRKE